MTWQLTGSALLFALFLTMAVAQTSPSRIESKSGKNLLLVVNQGDQSMSLVDPAAAVQIGKVKTKEVRAHEVTASPDGRLAYLPIYGNSGVGKPGTDGGSLEIVDLDKESVIGSVDLGPVRPHWVRFGPDGMLYVSAELDKAIDVVDPRLQKKSAPFRPDSLSRTWWSCPATDIGPTRPTSARAPSPWSMWPRAN